MNRKIPLQSYPFVLYIKFHQFRVRVSSPKKIPVWGRSGITEVKWASYLWLCSKSEEDAYSVGLGVLDLKSDSGQDLGCWQFLILNGDLRRLWVSPKRNEDMNTYPVRNKRQQKRTTSQWKACWKPMGVCGWSWDGGISDHHMGWVLGSRSTIYKKVLETNLFKYTYIFLNYESRITHLQET